MISRRFILTLSIILLVIAIALHVIRGDYVLESYEKKDIFNEYYNTNLKSSPNFEVVKNEESERFLILYNSKENNSLLLYKNAEHVLGYMKKKFVSVDVENFKGNFSNYSTVILCFEDIDLFEQFEQLFRYTENGGNIIFAEKPRDGSKRFESIYRKLGIYEKGSTKSTTGIKLSSNIIIKGKELGTNWSFVTDSITVHLQENCRKLAVSGDDLSLIWEKDYGKGKIIFVNGNFLSYKNNRGLFTGILSNTSSVFIYPIINAKVTYIDNLPSPYMQGTDPVIKEDYRRTIEQFYRDLWWKKVLEIGSKYNVKYSGFFMKSYEESINSKNKDMSTLENEKNLKYFSRELFKNKGELGIQGYYGKDISNIGLGKMQTVNLLKEIEAYIKDMYKKYAAESYVPPSNKLTSAEREILKEAMPKLKVISSIYSTTDIDGAIYKQEFELGNDGILDFPRISYGYSYDYETKWSIYNGITTHGVFSHFITPEEVGNSIIYEGKKLDDVMDEFSEIMEDNFNDFKWLRSATSAEAALELQRYLDCQTAFKYEDKDIYGYLKNFRESMYLILRSDKEPEKIDGCKIISEIDENVYLVKVESSEFHIGLGD